MIFRVFIIFLLSLLFLSSFADDEIDDDEDGSGLAVAKLLSACMRNGDNVEDVISALDDGADINVRDSNSGQTPLMAAVRRGKPNIVKVLLEEGADTSLEDHDGYTPAHGAAMKGSVAVFKILKENGIDIMNDRLDDGFYPFHRTCMGSKVGHRESVQYFLSEGIDINLEAGNGKTCIELATNKKIKRMLLEKGADPRGEDEEEL
mmetsp:Transcript_31442/g.47527  ORF Transcript_31442/g.47527 Transcript_31442/m.47527 type:complete len:205 (-) Transcript_31442:2793-3407(-)